MPGQSIEERVNPELARFAGLLPELIWSAVVNSAGFTIGFYARADAPVDHDVTRTHASVIPYMLQYILSFYRAGETRYSIIGGDHPIYAFSFNEMTLIFVLERFVPMDPIQALIRGEAQPLVSLLRRMDEHGRLPDDDAS